MSEKTYRLLTTEDVIREGDRFLFSGKQDIEVLTAIHSIGNNPTHRDYFFREITSFEDVKPLRKIVMDEAMLERMLKETPWTSHEQAIRNWFNKEADKSLTSQPVSVNH